MQLGPRGFGGRWLLGALLVLLVASCQVRRTFDPSPGPYDRIDANGRAVLIEARQRLDTGDLVRAAELLDELLEREPLHIPAAILRQEVRLADLVRAGTEPAAARAELEEIAQERAERLDDVVQWLLHARIVDRASEAWPSLDRAAALDPRCVWVAYARAWWSYRDRDFKSARERVEEAFRLDPGHLETLRLYARLQAGGGEVPIAMDALGLWIERAAESPRTTLQQLFSAEVDLAALLVVEDRPDEALQLIDGIDLDRLDRRERARAELVRAAAFESAQLPRLALRSAERAGEIDSADLLPYVHRAMLLEVSDPAGAEQAWRDLLELAESQRLASRGQEDDRGFQPLLLELRARFEVAKAEARRATESRR